MNKIKYEQMFKIQNDIVKALNNDIRRLARLLNEVEDDEARLRLIESIHHLIIERKKNVERLNFIARAKNNEV